MKEKLPRFIKYENRAGEIHTTRQGYKIKILKYHDFKNCDIIFEYNGLIRHNISYDNIIKGAVKNPYHPSMCGIGFIGEGEYTSCTNNVKTMDYEKWSSMFKRCYSEKSKEYSPSYEDCIVDPHWHNFQNFAQWYEENYNPEIMEDWQLDKDILVKGNKIYSPETCCFVPQDINGLFSTSKVNRGKYPSGITVVKRNNTFIVRLSRYGVRHFLGVFNTIEEAFQVYKTAKEVYIKEVADKWKDQINLKVYQALYNYQVEITD